MATVTLRDIVKVYGEFVAIKGIDLDIEDGTFVVLVGPSGCGKSTLLRMIAGLETISHGELRIGEKLSTTCPRASAASPWCSSPTRSIRI
jgi:ABC-type sugar transport system ATPase subunit